MDLKGKTVVITGGSDGVGAACARAFAAAGAKLVLAARGRKKLEAIAEELRPLTEVSYSAMDVTDFDACATLVRKAHFDFGSLDVLVNNAGFHERGAVERIDAKDLARMIDVNLRAPIVLTRLALPYLKAAREAAIINVASLAGRTPTPNSATYSASKFGLRAFTLALAEELADTNIKVAAVSPGPIDTGFIMADIDKVSDLTFSQPISTAEAVAGQVVQLCSNRKREASMPPVSGWLTTLIYLFPALGRRVRPLLERKGRRVKQRLRAARRAAES